MNLVNPTAPTFAWLIRPRRVLLLLAAIWILNAFDLAYTMNEVGRHGFVELNPLAAGLLHAPGLLIAYKLTLVLIGSALLLATACHSTAEWACWFLLATYAYVGLRWTIYFTDLLPAAIDPFVAVAPF